MKRPSYFQQIAPQAPARRRAGLPVLTPPPLLFRPGAAAIEIREIAEPAKPAVRQALRNPRQANLDVLPPITRLGDAGFVPDIMPPAPPRTVLTANQPVTPGQAVPLTPPAMSLPMPPAASSRAEMPLPYPQTPPTALKPQEVAAPVFSNAANPSPVPPPLPAVVPPESGFVQKTRPARAPEPLDITARPDSVATAPPVLRAERPPASAALPVITPPPPPPRPAAAVTARPAAPPSLHIGTLEVRVLPPAPPPVVAAPSTRLQARAASRPAATMNARLTRGFGVFGLGQS